MDKKYTVIFYKGQPMDVNEAQRNALLQEINNPSRKCAVIKDRVIMFGNIADIDLAGRGYDDEAIGSYNPLQLEEPDTYVTPETKAKVDSYMKKFKDKFIV